MGNSVILMVESDLAHVPNILSVLQSAVPPNQITLWKKEALPMPADKANRAFEGMAKSALSRVRPKPHQKMRPNALRFALEGNDTIKIGMMEMLEGVDASMRNALGGLSKSLKPLFPADASPIDRIATREKIYDKEGQYLGTRYTPTKLGARVRELLKAEGAL